LVEVEVSSANQGRKVTMIPDALLMILGIWSLPCFTTCFHALFIFYIIILVLAIYSGMNEAGATSTEFQLFLYAE